MAEATRIMSERIAAMAATIHRLGIDVGQGLGSGMVPSIEIRADPPSREGGTPDWLGRNYRPPGSPGFIQHQGFHGPRNMPAPRDRLLANRAYRQNWLLTESEPFGNISSSEVADADSDQRIQDMPRRRNRQLCECGCGNMTETGRFLRGHATRRRWQLIKAAELSVDDRTTWDDPANGPRPLAAVRHELGSRGWRMPVSRRTFGIEFELVSPVPASDLESALRAAGVPVYNYGAYTTRNSMTAWTIKTDSSIHTRRIGGRGYEIVSPPLRGKRGEAMVRKVLKVLNDMGCSVNQSCGTHVHVGASDLSVDGIRNVVLGYAAHQEAIDMLHAPSRRQSAYNNYCRAHRPRELETVRDARTVSGMAVGTRYLNVNLNAYPRIGTVEFRQHGGTLNATKILAWVSMVRGMVQAAPKIDLSAVEAGTVVRHGATRQNIQPILNAVGIHEDVSRYLYNRYLAA